MIKIKPHHMKGSEVRENFLFPQHKIFLHHLTLKAGKRHCVYRASDYPELCGENPKGVNTLRSVTVIPPPGHVRIFSPALSTVGDWPGCYSNVGGGVVFNADFHYEAVVDSDWLCVSWFPERRETPGAIFERRVLEAGESFVFTEHTEVIVSMLGTEATNAFTGDVGDEFVADEKTLIAIVTKEH